MWTIKGSLVESLVKMDEDCYFILFTPKGPNFVS